MVSNERTRVSEGLIPYSTNGKLSESILFEIGGKITGEKMKRFLSQFFVSILFIYSTKIYIFPQTLDVALYFYISKKNYTFYLRFSYAHFTTKLYVESESL